MTDFISVPLRDRFTTTLLNDIDSTQLSATLADAPGFTVPANQKVYMGIDYDSTNKYEVVEVTAVSGSVVTFGARGIATISGGGSSATSHGSGAKVVISNNWNVFNDIATAVNSKLDKSGGTMTGPITTVVYADATARDTAIPTPANGMSVYLIAEAKFTDYVTGSWVDRGISTPTPNASETVAGKVQQATLAEQSALTELGGTGAPVFMNPKNAIKDAVPTSGDEGKTVLLSSDGINKQLMPSLLRFGGTGADGDLTINSGTTTLNLDQVYNYNNVTINSPGVLAFTGVNGVAYLNIKGDLAGDGTIELRNAVTSNARDTATHYGIIGGGLACQSITTLTGGAGGATSFTGGAGGNSNAIGTGTGGGGGAISTNGTAGAGGSSSSVGGGGGGGAGSNQNAGTAGTNASGDNGGNGGAGGGATDSTGIRLGSGGGGGGGRASGNGGNGGAGGSWSVTTPSGRNISTALPSGGRGGNSGDTGGTGGVGGFAGAIVPTTSSGVDLASLAGGLGGNGGDGYAGGGNGGNGFNWNIRVSSTPTGSSTNRPNGGAGGNSSHGNGGVGGTGGSITISQTVGSFSSCTMYSGNGGNGGNGRNGGNGGNGGGMSAVSGSYLGNIRAGDGGNGGDARTGCAGLLALVAGNITFSGTINGAGGNGGNGGNGGSITFSTDGFGGNGGNGGAGSNGSDVVLLALGTASSPTINTAGGTGGTGGTAGTASGGTNGTAGTAGATGRTGKAVCHTFLI